jgi:hypothetical protein
MLFGKYKIEALLISPTILNQQEASFKKKTVISNKNERISPTER